MTRCGAVPLAVFLVGTFLPLLPTPLRSQDPKQLGAALEAACGVELDPATEGVVMGTVSDSISGVALPGAAVRLAWRMPGDSVDSMLETETDRDGFYGFCRVPAGVRVTLSATLRVSSNPVEMDIEAGVLLMEPLFLSLSTAGSTGVLLGRIVDPRVRHPVADAIVRLVELGRAVTTNSRGYFSFGNQPWGVYTLEVSRLGYAPLTTGVRVAGNLTQIVELELDPEALELEGITVRVATQPAGREIDGLVRRMTLGFGSFITRETIERRPGARVADLLQEVPGVTVRRGLYGAIDLQVRGRTCVPEVFVDGILHILDPDLGLDFHVGELEAVEVYKGVETPGEFLRAGRRAFPCAVVVVWTRKGP